MIDKEALIISVFEKLKNRDNSALIKGAEKHIEKVTQKKFKREEKELKEVDRRSFMKKIYREILNAELLFDEK